MMVHVLNAKEKGIHFSGNIKGVSVKEKLGFKLII
jgi:hypothetical protein